MEEEIEIESGYYCCEYCKVFGSMDSVVTTKPKVSFCFKEVEKNAIHNLVAEASIVEDFTGNTVLNKMKLAMSLCKMPPYLITVVNKHFVSSMKSKSD